ncbi:MAG: signal recognition particle-docking protein FtsY [Ruminococcaceae bacterium]|nr:signal recognition particle-docking protein FtsY [Oscillospiraceae bacterium]
MGFFDKLKQGLTKTKRAVMDQMDTLFKSFVAIDEDMLEELEEILIMADVGAATASEIIEKLRDTIATEGLTEASQAKKALMNILKETIGEGEPLKLDSTPSVILVIGVNGVGKTTTIAKIANNLIRKKKKVMLAAGDTFRAGAIEQLQIWADRVGADIVKHTEGSDPAAVVFDAISAAKNRKSDVLIVDTAGRLHNKKNLMDELAKINRVIGRELPDASRETLLVLDATTGQNAVIQAKEFKNAADITGLVLTKLDGSAKGGIVFSIKRELGLPIKYIGVGEKADDMEPFDADDFVRALFD